MSSMTCTNCGAENPGHVNFCKQCGSKLEGEGQTAKPAMTTPTGAITKEQAAFSENISVLLDIEENTRQATILLKNR